MSPVSPARAAWEFGAYHYKQDGTVEPRIGYAIRAIKQELIYVGAATDALRPDLAVYGDACRNSVARFQQAHGLDADGIAGAATLRELFRMRVVNVEDRNGLPRGILGRELQLESAWDPAAVGYVDPADRGLAMINAQAHPDVSDDEAFDPAFAIPWAGRKLKADKERIETEVDTLKAARAAYNIGVEYAKRWMLEKFPASGGPLLGDQDAYTRATKYIEVVDKQVW